MAFNSRKFIDLCLRLGGQLPDIPCGRHIPPHPFLLASVIEVGVIRRIDTDWLRKEVYVHGSKSFLNKGDRVTGRSLCFALV